MHQTLKHPVTPEALEQFRQLLNKSMGIYFSKDKTKELEQKLERVMKTFQFEDVQSCLDFLNSTPLTKKHILNLAKDLTVGETYFFRHAPSFQALEQWILPRLIQSKKDKTLRIWSAGCCTGEEVYSVAILLTRLISRIQDWSITLLATDINEEFLEKARKGVYKEWSFRGTPDPIREAYFKRLETKSYELIPQIRNMVQFEYLNLIEDTYPSWETMTGEMDLILCNNVLIYFERGKIPAVVDKFTRSLREGGWLIVSTVEAPYIENPHLTVEKYGELQFFRRDVSVNRVRTHDAQRDVQAVTATILPKIQEKEKELVKALELSEEGGLVADVKAHADQGNLTRALEVCEEGLKVYKVSHALHYLHAVVLYELGCVEEAVQAMKRALFLDPDFVLAHFFMGTVMLQQQKMKEAQRHFRNVRSLLERYESEAILPGSDDLTVERVRSIVDHLGKEINHGA